MDINKVAQFVIENHSKAPNAFRKVSVNGQFLPYWQHCFDVYKTVWRCGLLDEVTGPASQGHDLPEECKWLRERSAILPVFGERPTDVIFDLTYIPDETLPKEEQRQAKNQYLFDLRHKSIEAVVIKPCDRYRNVIDFIKQGDVRYAEKYLDKGQVIWDNVEHRREEIEARWGDKAYRRVMGLRTRLWEILVNYSTM